MDFKELYQIAKKEITPLYEVELQDLRLEQAEYSKESGYWKVVVSFLIENQHLSPILQIIYKYERITKLIQIAKNKRTHIFTNKDFEQLLRVIQDLINLVVLPKIWTEVGHLLNSLSGNYKYLYIQNIKSLSQLTNEEFLSREAGAGKQLFYTIRTYSRSNYNTWKELRLSDPC